MQPQPPTWPRPATTTRSRRAAGLACAIGAVLAIAAGTGNVANIGRPDPKTDRHLASCKLQSITKPATAPMTSGVQFVASPPTADDALANYQRTPLGDWQMPGEVDRADPWLRFLLLGPRRPLVIDVALFVDGKPYSDGREAWIDDALRGKPALPEKIVPEKIAQDSPPASSENPPAGNQVVATVKSEPQVASQVRRAPSMRERLQSYLGTTGPTVDRKEIRWLIAEWGFGPPVVVMDSSLSWQRAATAPLLAYLDRDRDGALSAAEIAQVDELLDRADVNADDVVDEAEIRRQFDVPPVLTFATGHPLVVLLDAATDRDALAVVASRVYGFDEEQYRRLVGGSADVTLRAAFGDDAKTQAGVSLLAVGPEFAGLADAVAASADVITLDLGAEYLEFSAAERAADAKADAGNTQIAVGAAFDGNPLWRLADRDQDHRLTRRERREIAGLLAALDRNDDGQIAAAEMPLPIRFAVALGPQVHTLLAQPTGAARAIAPREAPSAPSWFTSMDRNNDGDLSPGEFLGTTEQFGQIDADGDGLVSVREAQEAETGR